ncbi:MAG: LysM peptidoglycan-binding domain-containing protein, partial [Acidobacteria bacterium]|nr:LysM peptidoglycan-binding domain-containing protein [Acidobacteriota bacterium]
MGFIHIVEEGEHLSGIAARFGFSSFRTILEHPENAELKKLRKNPNVLFAGDRLFIPTRETKEEEKPTDKKHRFVTAREQLVLRVKVLDNLEKPRPEPCTLTGSGFQNNMSDVGEGVLEGLIPQEARKAELFFPSPSGKEESDVKVPLAVGFLDPVTEPPGQRQRLNNLGYFAGFDPTAGVPKCAACNLEYSISTQS